MHEMFNLTRQPKEKKTTPASREPAWFLIHVMMLCRCKIAAKTVVSDSSAQLHLKERNTGIPGTIGAAGHLKEGAETHG